MSSDTTSIQQLPQQDLSQSHSLNNTIISSQGSQGRQINEGERRLNADDISQRIQSMTTAIPPQSQPHSQPQSQSNTVQQNEMGSLLNSINQLTTQSNSQTGIPIHQINAQTTTMDPYSQVNHIDHGQQPLPSATYQQPPLREQELNNHNNQIYHGNPKERKSFYQSWFDELKIPLLICCLFFIFQMPFYRQNLHKHFKFLFQSDGNMNLYGYVSSSILFSIGYYILNKVIK